MMKTGNQVFIPIYYKPGKQVFVPIYYKLLQHQEKFFIVKETTTTNSLTHYV